MDREVARDLYATYERVSTVLGEAETIVWRMPEGEERKQLILALSGLQTDIAVKLKVPILRQYPEFDADVPEGLPDTLLVPEDQAAVSRLTAAEIATVDAELLADCASSWRKVARIVGSAINTLGDRFPDVPLSYYAQRVVVLVHGGQLEAQGNLDYVRYSEVRLPKSQA